ncbi:MAG: hypothetical protein MUO73_03960 [Thermoplasmata archaeon]|nr:hypothetical protein [Thermoplasmata archaeon]
MESMKENSEEKQDLSRRIDKALHTWEKENEDLKNFLKKIEEDNSKYLQESLKKQEEYKEIINKIVDLENTKQCEKIINRIAKDIPADIIYPDLLSLFQQLLEKEKAEELKELNLEDDSVKAVFSEEQRNKASILDREERKLRKEINEGFQGATNTIFPFLRLTRDQWSFLWNLASWKSNLLLTKQMKRYTFWVFIFTILLAVFTILTFYFTFFK